MVVPWKLLGFVLWSKVPWIKQDSLLLGVLREVCLSLPCFPHHGQASHPVLLCNSNVLHLYFYTFCLLLLFFFAFLFLSCLVYGIVTIVLKSLFESIQVEGY